MLSTSFGKFETFFKNVFQRKSCTICIHMYIHINLGLWYKFQVGAYSLHFRVLHEHCCSTKCHYHYTVLYSVHFRVASCKVCCCEKYTRTVFFNCVFYFGFLRFSAFSEPHVHVSYFVKIKHMYTFIVRELRDFYSPLPFADCPCFISTRALLFLLPTETHFAPFTRNLSTRHCPLKR